MRTLKVALIVFFSILGIVGATVLGLYLTGKLNVEAIPPADIFYADVTVDENGNQTFTSHTGEYFASSNFEMIIGTTSKSEDYNQTKVNLDFGTTVAKRYLKVNSETLTPYCYTLDENGNQVKYELTDEANGNYITNGKIVVPKTVTIGRAFKVLLCVSTDEASDGAIDENTKLYNIGGTVVLYAQSEAKSLSRINTTINIDVPVESIRIIPTTSNGGEEKVLNTIIENDKLYYVVNLETFFGLKVEFSPARSAYLYGKDGSNGTAQFKKVIFGLNNDEENIVLVDADGNMIAGVSDIARMLSVLSGDGEVFARVFKNAADNNANAGLSLAEQYELMANSGVSASANIRVTNITIDGFEISDKYHGAGNELDFDINNRLIITANNELFGKSLQIGILADGYSQGAVQKEIENIYLSIQVFKNGSWVDATAGDNKYFAFVGSQVYVMNLLDSDYYGFNFYQVKFNRNMPNNSYWEIAALANNENADYSSIRIQVFYKSSEGIVENNSKYGPYDVECVVNPVVEPEVEWNDNSDYKQSDELVADNRNEEILFYVDGVANPIIIDLTNLGLITNLDQNPANTLIKYFICSKTDANLDSKINCRKYNGQLQGLPTGMQYVYELLSDEKLIISSMGDVSEFEFDIVFAVVQNDFYGNAVKDGDSYVIKALPSAQNGSLITLPFRISKTVDISNESLSVVINTPVSPYGEPTFVLQRTSNSLKLAIKIKTTDVEIFKKQVDAGNITLHAYENNVLVNYLHYYNDGVNYPLENALAAYLETNPTVLTDGEYTIFEINLSTGEIAFADAEDEKAINIVLNYVVNTEKGDMNFTASTTNINIYSGKINDLKIKYSYIDDNGVTVEKYFEGNEIINIVKRIVNNVGVTEISTIYTMEIDGQEREIVILTNDYLNVEFTKYGIDDVLNISSSNSLVLQVSYMSLNDEIKYQLSALKSGENVRVTFKPQFAHSNFKAITLVFNIDANFEVDANDTDFRNGVASTPKDGILNYDPSRGYTIIGAPIKQTGDKYEIVAVEDSNVEYLFKNLVQVSVTTSAGSVVVNDKLKFTLEIPDDLKSFIELIYVDGELIGFKPIAKLGKAANLVVYYYSSEVGFNSGVLNINLASYYQAQGTIDNHDGADVSQKEPDAKFVFAEADIILNNFKVLGFNLETGIYDVEINTGLGAKIAAILNQLTAITSDETNLLNILQIFASQDAGELIFTPISIKFAPVSQVQKYVLTFAFNDNVAENAYNFSIDYIFYVQPNIKVDKKKIFEVRDEIYYLNNQENPFKNGYTLYWFETTSDGVNVIKFPFSRICGVENFVESKFNFAIYEVGAQNGGLTVGTQYTISGVKKLSLYELVVYYAENKFTFRYFAEPNLNLPEEIEKVTYNGEEYLSLYAKQDISGLTVLSFGSLANNGNILSYAELSKKTGNINEAYTRYGNLILNINKNKFGLFETYVVLTNGSTESEEYVVYKALIFPEQWSYIDYGETAVTDVYQILNGEVVKNIKSGKDIENFANTILANNFEYEIYDLTDSKLLEKDNLLINVDVKNKTIKTNPMGKNHKFRITFKVNYPDIAGTFYAYTFNYYVEATASQTIEINYPYTGSGNGEILEDFSISHKVYYDEFENNQYIIDLKSNKNNMFGKEFVKLTSSGEGEFNNLIFEIVKVYVNNEIITNNISSYVTIDNNGKVVLKNVSYESLNVLIKISTKNGAEGYYKISVQNRAVNYVIGVDDTETGAGFAENEIEKLVRKDLQDGKYDLSNYVLRIREGSSSYSEVKNLPLHFAVLNKDGVLQTTSNIIYYDSTKQELVVGSSPIKQTATLYAFTSEGVVAKIEIDIDSPISISQTRDNYDGGENDAHGLYGDQIVDLFKYLSISYEGTKVEDVNGYKFTIIANDYVSIDGKNLVIKPYFNANNEFIEITIKVQLWGETQDESGNPIKNPLPGTSEDIKCELEITFSIMPNVIVDNQTVTVKANQTLTWKEIDNLFNLKKGGGYSYNLGSFTHNLLAEELKLYETSNTLLEKELQFDTGTKTLTFAPKPVMAKREIVITFKISKGDFETTGTLTITIEPDTDVEINYPDFGTGRNFDALYIYKEDYKDNILDLIESKYIQIIGKGTNTQIVLRATSDYISITNNKITLTGDALSLESNETIVISIYVDGLLRSTFTLVICNNPVFTASFDNGFSEISEDLLKDEVTGNPFWFVDGSISIKTEQNRRGLVFGIYIIARNKLTGVETRVLIGGEGSQETVKSAVLYFADYDSLDRKLTLNKAIERNADNTYSFAKIFADEGIDIATCEFYFGEFVVNENQVVLGSNLQIKQPTKRITYYYNGFEMTFSEAATLFKVGGKKISEFGLQGEGESGSYTLINANSSVEIAKYEFKVVKDYKFDDNNFANSPTGGSTSSVTKDTYNDKEFDNLYGEQYRVSKTIELTAGNSYSLIELLRGLGLTSYRGGAYQSKEKIYLEHGNYTTNENFKYNLGSLISLQSILSEENIIDYTITPNGAKKGGDIVHLVVRFGADELASTNAYADADTYIIRIKILPSITITPTSASGENILSYEGNTTTGLTLTAGTTMPKNTDNLYFNIPLSKLVTISGNYDITKMIVSVGSGSEYVVGAGYANRLGKLPDSDEYGIQFNKTIFGGNIIELTISDRFGYSESIRVQYLNSKNVSPTILSNPSSIFEGDQFTLAFYKGLDKNGLKEYQCFGAQSGSLTETTLAGIPNVIIINGFDQIEGVKLTNEGTGDLVSYNLGTKEAAVDGTKLTLGYNDNSIFGNNIRLLPNEFGLKIRLTVQNSAIGKSEVVELDVNTSLNQRYKVQAKGDYGRYSTIYLGNGNDYKLTDLFEIYDLKLGATTDKVKFADNGSNNSETKGYLIGIKDGKLTFGGASFAENNKISATEETKFKFNLSGEGLGTSVDHEYGFNIALTPKYYAVEMKDADQNYGIVVDGNAQSSYSGTDWKGSIIYLDYYGNVVATGEISDVLYSKVSGIGTLSSDNLSALSANSPVTIAVNSDGVEIGQVMVTMRRYYALTGGGTSSGIGSTNKLDFALWTNGIKALVVQTTTGEDLSQGIGLFTYSTITKGYDITYEDGQYKLVKISDNFKENDEVAVIVKYMGKELGMLRISIQKNTNGDVVVVDLPFDALSVVDEGKKEIILAKEGSEQNKTIKFEDWANLIQVYNSQHTNIKVSLYAVYSLFNVTITTNGYKLEGGNIVKTDQSAFSAGEISIAFSIKYKKSDGTEQDCGSQTLKFNIKAPQTT